MHYKHEERSKTKLLRVHYLNSNLSSVEKPSVESCRLRNQCHQHRELLWHSMVLNRELHIFAKPSVYHWWPAMWTPHWIMYIIDFTKTLTIYYYNVDDKNDISHVLYLYYINSWPGHKIASTPSEIISNKVCGTWLGTGKGANVIISL